MSTSVKHIHNGMRGAPALSGTAGTLLAVLEALFVTGWGATTAVSVNVAGGIATATLIPGDTFDRDAVVLVAGATPGALNGEARVLTSGNTAITWATTAPDGAATGTITIKYAPQTAWSKPFAATNKAVFRSTHVQSNGHYLRIDDTGTQTARVRGYESMSDVDTGIGPFPTDAQMSGGGYLYKSTTASATAVRYKIICDERFILFCAAPGTSSNVGNKVASARGFGDPISLAPGGDAWGTILSINGAGTASHSGSLDCAIVSTINGMIVMPRAVSALGSAVMCDPVPFTGLVNNVSGSDASLGRIPSEVDGRIRPSTLFAREQGSEKPPRVSVPGVHYVPHTGATLTLQDGDFLDGSGALTGRRLMCVATGSSFVSSPTGMYLVDITGPWR